MAGFTEKQIRKFKTRKQIERTRNFLREVDNLHSKISEVRYFYEQLPAIPKGESAELYRSADNELSKLFMRTDVNGAGDLASVKEVFANYKQSAEAFFDRYKRDLQEGGKASDAEFMQVEMIKKRTLGAITEQYYLALNASRGLEYQLLKSYEEQPPYELKFTYVYGKMKNAILQESLSKDMADLHKEVSEPADEDFEWMDEQIDDLDEGISNQDYEKLSIRAGLDVSKPESDLKRFNANYAHIKSTDYSAITGEDHIDTFLRNKGLTGRATGQSIFLHYLMGVKGLSFKEALSYTHAHDKKEDGNYVNEEAHKKAEAYEKDFVVFLNENPLQTVKGAYKAENAKDAEKAVKAWTNLFSGSMEKLKSYRLPEIDYSDPEQVRMHFEELYALTSLSVDGHQELDKMLECPGYNEHFSSLRVAAEALGDEKKLWQMRQFYDAMQGMTLAGIKAPYYADKMGSENEYAAMVKHAVYRENAGIYMSDLAGKTIGDAMKENPYKFIFGSLEGVNWERIAQGSLLIGNRQTPELAIQPKAAFNYLINRNQIALKNYIKDKRGILEDRHHSQEYPGSDLEKQLNYRKELAQREGLKAFLTVDDRAESMETFLKNPVSGNKTGADLVCGEFGDLLYKYKHGHMYEKGLTESDMFLVNGQSAKELWGEKYSHITDPGKKEMLLRAEILKAIAEGKSTITVKGFVVTKDKTFEPNVTSTILLPREKMMEMRSAFIAYRMEKENLVSLLEESKKELLNTQENVQDFGIRGGSALYVAYAKALKECLEELKKENFNDPEKQYSRIREKLVNLEKASAAYYKAREGTKNEKSMIRIVHAQKTKEGLVSQFDSLRSGFAGNNLQADANRTFAEANEYLLKQDMDFLSQGLGLDVIDYAKEADSFYREKLNTVLNEIKESAGYREIMARVPEDDAKRALKYLSGYYENLAEDPLSGEQKRLVTVEDLRNAENIMESYKTYEKDSVFQRYMKEDPEKTIKKWHEVEAGEKTIKTAYTNHLNTRINGAGSAERYIAGLKAGENPEKTLNDAAREINALPDHNPEKEMRRYGMYARLAEVLTLQILSSGGEEAKLLREGIHQNTENMEAIKGSILNEMLSAGLLDSNNKINKTVEQLRSGKLRTDLFARFKKDAAERSKKAEEEKKSSEHIAELNKNNRYFLMFEPNHKFRPEELNQLYKESGIADAKKAMSEITAPAVYFSGTPVEYEENGEKKTVTANDELWVYSGFNGSRADTVQAVFTLWVMATQSIGFKEAAEICYRMPKYGENNVLLNKDAMNESNKLRAQFMEFVKANPKSKPYTYTDTRGKQVKTHVSVSKEEGEKAAKNWSQIFIKATEKMKEYQIPDINYRDKNEVAKNIKELTILTSVMTNESQEFDNLFYSEVGVHYLREFKREIGGEEKFRSFAAFWNNIEAPLSAFAKAYTTAASLVPGVEKNILMNWAANRQITPGYMQQIKGMTVAQAAEYSGKKGWPEYVGRNAIRMLTNAMEGKVAGSDFKDAIDSMIGFGSEKYAREIEAYRQEEIRALRATKPMSFMIAEKAGSFYMNLNMDVVKEALLPIAGENEVEKLREFLNNPGQYSSSPNAVDKTRLGKDWLSSMYAPLFKEPGLNRAAAALGIQGADLFLIDGQLLSEKYADKFASVADPVEKEQLMLLEALREISYGRSEVSLRSFDYENGEYVEGKPIPVSPRRDWIYEQVLDDVYTYPYARKEILASLKTFRRRFINTQDDKRANFYANQEGVIEEEGNTQEYKNMTAGLKNLIALLEADADPKQFVEKKDILDAFDRLARDTRKYYAEHVGLFTGLWHKSGRDRKGLSLELSRDILKLKEDYLAARKGFDNNYIALSGERFKDCSYQKILRAVKHRQNRFNSPVHSADYYKNNYNLNTFKRNFDEFFKLRFNIPANKRVEYKRAYTYLRGLYDETLEVKYVPADNIMTPEEIKVEMYRLANNPVFQRLMHDDPVSCVRKWGTIEENMLSTIEASARNIQSLKRGFGNSAAYIACLPKRQAGQRLYTFDDAVHNFNMDNPEEIYKRATDVIFLQLVSDRDINKELVYALCRDEIVEQTDMASQIREQIKGYLTRFYGFNNPAEIRNTLALIMNGNIKNDIKGVIFSSVPGLANNMKSPDALENAEELERDRNIFNNELKEEIKNFNLKRNLNPVPQANVAAGEGNAPKENVAAGEGNAPKENVAAGAGNAPKENAAAGEKPGQLNADAENAAKEAIEDALDIDEGNLDLKNEFLVEGAGQMEGLGALAGLEIEEIEKTDAAGVDGALDDLEEADEFKSLVNEPGKENEKGEDKVEEKPQANEEENLLNPKSVIIDNPVIIQDDPKKNLLDHPEVKELPVINPEVKEIRQGIGRVETAPVVNNRIVIKEDKPFVANNVSFDLNQFGYGYEQDEFGIFDFASQDDIIIPENMGEDIRKQHAWEFPAERGSQIPKEIMNIGNANAIRIYLNNNKQLDAVDQAFLRNLADANEKIREKIQENTKKIANGENPGTRLAVVRTNNGGVEILGTNQPAFQSSDNGCWSCSAAMLLQGRGVKDLTQEEIRLFRVNGNEKDANAMSEDATNSYNKDVTNRIIESGDLLTYLAPDSVVREMTVMKHQAHSGLTEDEYLGKAVNKFKTEIRNAIEKDKSPVSLLRNGHYVTIVGIEEREGAPYVKVKDSIKHPGDEDPNAEKWVKLEDVIQSGLTGAGANNFDGVSITWMADQKIDLKTGKLLNVPSDLTSVDKQGRLVTPPQEIQVMADIEKDERQKFGRTVLRQGGTEKADANALSKDGLFIQERAYIPNQMHYDYLSKKAGKSAFELETDNARDVLKTMGPVDPKNNPLEFREKVNNILLAVCRQTLKEHKLPLNDANGKSALDALNKKEIKEQLGELAKKNKGEDILKALDGGKLLSNIKGVKDVKINPPKVEEKVIKK